MLPRTADPELSRSDADGVHLSHSMTITYTRSSPHRKTNKVVAVRCCSFKDLRGRVSRFTSRQISLPLPPWGVDPMPSHPLGLWPNGSGGRMVARINISEVASLPTDVHFRLLAFFAESDLENSRSKARRYSFHSPRDFRTPITSLLSTSTRYRPGVHGSGSGLYEWPQRYELVETAHASQK